MGKLAGIIFVVFLFMAIFKYTELFKINLFILIGTFCLWLVVAYVQVHFKNKERNIPKPVYMVDE